jgi:prepilin-type N-terminal cleavage/methylation domain-containing protein
MDQLNQRGLTLIELLVVIAILAILAVGGYSVLRLIPSTGNATAKTVFKQAVRQLTIQALSDEGAELTWDGQGHLELRSLGANPVVQSYTLPNHETITINGQPFSCLVLNPKGFPDNAAVPSCKASNPSVPLIWSLSNGTYRISFQ